MSAGPILAPAVVARTEALIVKLRDLVNETAELQLEFEADIDLEVRLCIAGAYIVDAIRRLEQLLEMTRTI